MPIDTQVLKEYVATANSNKYNSWEELNSKFPELNGYDSQVLKEYVATANSNKYKSWEELNSKFPEFSETVKKKETTESSSEDGSSVTPKQGTQKPSESLDFDKYEYDEETNTWQEKDQLEEKLKGSAIKVLSLSESKKQITDPELVNRLNKQFNKQASTSDVAQVFTGYPGKEKNEYTIIDGKWHRRMPGKSEFSEIKNVGSVQALNREFGQNVGASKYRNVVIDEVGQKKQQEKEQLKVKLNSVDGNLVDLEEEEAITKLKQLFPDFKFEKSGALTDNVKVIAPGGVDKKTFPFDNFSSSADSDVAEQLKSFLNTYSNKDLVEKMAKEQAASMERAGALTWSSPDDYMRGDRDAKAFLSGIKVQKTREDLTDEYNNAFIQLKLDKKTTSEQIASLPKNESIVRSIESNNSALEGKMNDYNSNVEEFNRVAESLTEEEYNERLLDLKDQSENIKDEIQKSTVSSKALGAAITNNSLIREEQGNFGSGMGRNFVSGLISLDRLFGLSPEEHQQLLDDIVGVGSTKEYIQSENRSDLLKAMFSVSESLGVAAPALLTGGGSITSGALFFNQSYHEMKDELDQVEGMDGNTKFLMSSAYGLVSAALENFGLGVALNKSKVGNALAKTALSRFLKEIPVNATKETIEQVLRKTTGEFVADLTTRGLKSSLAEGTTEALQYLSGEGVKELYDIAKGTDLFKHEDLLKQTWENFYIGALAGGITSATNTSMEHARKFGIDKLENKQMATLMRELREPQALKEKKNFVNEQLKHGLITQEEAKTTIEKYDAIHNALNTLPENIKPKVAKEALGLMAERKKLESEIEGKEETLVVEQKERIKDINDKLTELGKTKEEQTTDVDLQITKEKIESLEDDQEINLSYKSMDDVPDFLKSIAKKGASGTTKVGVFGKKQEVQRYNVQSTGKEIKDLYNANQEQTTDVESEMELQEQEVVAEEEVATEESPEEVRKKIKRKDLFNGVERFSKKLGGSNVESVPTSHTEIDGIEFVQYSNPETGDVDIIMTGKSENDFVGYYRLYENGKPTNRWSSKFENKSRNKADFKKMIAEVQSMLPSDHQYTEKTSISTDGLRVWGQQLERGYETQVDSDGNIVTDRVAINGDAIVNELGIDVSPGNFRNIVVRNKKQFETVKKALTPYLEKLGLNENNIYWENGTVKIDLPVLTKTKKEQEVVAEEGKKEEEVVKSIEEKIKVFRGKGNNFSEGINEGMVWVAEDESVAKNYASINDDGSFNVEEKEILKPENAFELPYKFNTDVRSSNIGDNLRDATKMAMDEGTISKDEVSDILDMIDKYEEEAGDNLEPYHTKINKPEASRTFSDILLRLGHDAVLIKEGGSNTYGLITKPTQQSTEIEGETFETIKNLDTKDKTNLQKVQSWLNKMDEDLDNFGKETLGVNIPVAVAKVVVKTVKTLVDAGVSLEQAIKQAAKDNNISETDVVEAFDKIQNKAKDTQASKAAKGISKKPTKKTTVNERTALRDQIKYARKIAREIAKNTKEGQEAARAHINERLKGIKGTFSKTQFDRAMKRAMKTRFYDSHDVARLNEYIDKVAKKAENFDKIKNALSLKSKIRKRLKNNQKDTKLAAKKFGAIDPIMVEDINKYIAIAEKVYNAVKPTTLGPKRQDYKTATELDEVMAYAEAEVARQDEIRKQNLLASDKGQLLLMDGVISEDMSLKEIQAAMKEKSEELDEDFMQEIKDIASDMQDRVKEMEDVSKDISDMANMDLESLSKKELVTLYEYLDNFLVNQTEDGTALFNSIIQGRKDAASLRKTGLRFKLKDKANNKFGNVIRKVNYLYVLAGNNQEGLLDRLLGSETNARLFKSVSGLAEFDEQKYEAQKKLDDILKSYDSKFSKIKDFKSTKNIFERGIYAYLSRNSEVDFEARKQNVLDTYEVLESSKRTDYEEIAKKLKKDIDRMNIKDAETINDIKVTRFNELAVKFWQQKWSENYGNLKYMSSVMYNKDLNEDQDYTPDFYRMIESMAGKEGTDFIDSGNFGNVSGIDTSMPGMLMDAKTPNGLKGNKRQMYLDFDFDHNMATKMEEALKSIYAERQAVKIKSFLETKEFEDAFTDNNLKDMVKWVLDDYVNRSMKRSSTSSPIELFNKLKSYSRSVNEVLDSAGLLGTTQVLGSITQLVKNVLPIIGNTYITLGKKAKYLDWALNKGEHNFIDNLNYPISTRGKEALTGIYKEMRYEKAGTSKVLRKSDKVSDFILDKTMGISDRYVARVAWMAYYKASLDSQGVKVGEIDWSTHKVNKEAAQYAQGMVDRQQNISDKDKKSMLDRSVYGKIINVIQPFSSFIMSAKFRIRNDINTIATRKADLQEGDRTKAAQSLFGTIIEIITFQTIALLAREGFRQLARMRTGDEEEDEKKLGKTLMNRIVSQTINDVMSPAPMVDEFMAYIMNTMSSMMTGIVTSQKEINEYIENIQDEIYEKHFDELGYLNKYKLSDVDKEELKEKYLKKNTKKMSVYRNENDLLNSLDFLGKSVIPFGKMQDIYRSIYETALMKYEDDMFGKNRYLPSEVKNFMYERVGYSLGGFVSKDFSDLSRNIDREIKKYSLSKSQYERYLETKSKTDSFEIDDIYLIKNTNLKPSEIADYAIRYAGENKYKIYKELGLF